MKADLQRWVQRSGWDRAAPHYEQYWQQQLRPAHDAMLDMAALRPGEKVLDVACGTGLVTLRAARGVGPSGQVLGTDVSSKMVERARARATDAAVDNVEFACADAEQPGEVLQPRLRRRRAAEDLLHPLLYGARAIRQLGERERIRRAPHLR